MIKKTMLISLLIISAFSLALSGCQPAELQSEEQIIIEDEGIYHGQIDSQSVEIEVDGQIRAFALGQGVVVNTIPEGSAVRISFIEQETRPELLSIAVIDSDSEDEPELLTGQGIYNGQIDSNSVEIEVDGEPVAFAISADLVSADLVEGAEITFSYIEEEYRPRIVSIDRIDLPIGGGDLLVGEGVYVGQIDAQSVEVEIHRAFVIGEEVTVDQIADGSLVVFSYTESGQRAILDSIEAVDEMREGNVLHGTLIGQIDAQSVEILYYKAFALGDGVSVADLDDGSAVVFTYSEGGSRPVLASITAK